jgi:hypothetical protein
LIAPCGRKQLLLVVANNSPKQELLGIKDDHQEPLTGSFFKYISKRKVSKGIRANGIKNIK